jgi:starch phosphorylase
MTANLKIPKSLSALNTIAHNFWWSWNQETWNLFSRVDEKTWQETRNPFLTLKNANESVLESLGKDNHYLQLLNISEKKLQTYIDRTKTKETWFQKTHPNRKDESIAYFCTEYGIHESLPIYSGGLGVLSGDHVKSSSDLGIPMHFIGLFYRNGYFTQQIDKTGQQKDVYPDVRPESLAVEKINLPELTVDLPGRKIFLNVYKVQVGINPLYLICSDHEQNSTDDRALTARLYGGDREMRISQEIILGIGGIRVLQKLNIKPTVFHMNEGHSGFYQLERVRLLMIDKNISFEEAKVLCASNCVFTTHTPVPAGNEAFSLAHMHKYFYEYAKEFGISWDEFIKLGLVKEKSDYSYFSLTVFAINFSRFQNGVSELHGQIAQKMWKDLWPDVSYVENPITSITNGVHVQTWTGLEMKGLFEKYMGGNWEETLADHAFWKTATEKIPNNALSEMRHQFKNKMISLVREQLKDQLKRNGESESTISAVDSYLKPEILTIGFARRFATYKRATLLFKDAKRLATMINNPDHPVQFVFAGKAHPQDVPGQQFIKDIYQMSRRPEFLGKIIIIENYDMNISRHLITGCDVWLNNPRRPLEASGTSGQKVPLNGGINFSVLDGWWRESYNGENGWYIGEEKDFESDEVQDFEDANDFYQNLESTIVPLYYQDKSKGIIGASNSWLDKSKISLSTNISHFSTHRMVQDYMNRLYAPAADYGQSFQKESKKSQDYLETRKFLKRNWKAITFSDLHFEGEAIEVGSDFNKWNNTPSHHVDIKTDSLFPGKVFETVKTKVFINAYLGDIPPEHIKGELLVTDTHAEGFMIQDMKSAVKVGNGVWHFQGEYNSPDGKPRRMRIRLLGTHDKLSHKFEYGLVSWL